MGAYQNLLATEMKFIMYKNDDISPINLNSQLPGSWFFGIDRAEYDIIEIDNSDYQAIDLDHMWFGMTGDVRPANSNQMPTVSYENVLDGQAWNFNIRAIHSSGQDPFSMPWNYSVHAVWSADGGQTWDDIMLGYEEYISYSLLNDNLQSGTYTVTGGDNSQYGIEDPNYNSYTLDNWSWGLNQIRNSTQETDVYYYVQVNDPATNSMIRSNLGQIVGLFGMGADEDGTGNPVTEGFLETSENWWYTNTDGSPNFTEPYTGYYHQHQDGTYHIGVSNPGEEHQIPNSEIIVQQEIPVPEIQINKGGPHGYQETILYSVNYQGNFEFIAPRWESWTYDGTHGNDIDVTLEFAGFNIPDWLTDYQISGGGQGAQPNILTISSVLSNVSIGVVYEETEGGWEP